MQTKAEVRKKLLGAPAEMASNQGRGKHIPGMEATPPTP